MKRFTCSQQVLEAARRNAVKSTWDYINGAAGSETTMRRNRYAIDSWALRPRVLRDVSRLDTSVTVLGHKLAMPVVLAPMGSMHLMHKDGALASSKAAGAFGTMHILSSVARSSVEEIAAVNPGPKVYQLYIRGDMDWVARKLDAAKRAGFAALAITVDSATYGIRDRQILNDFERPSTSISDESFHYHALMTWERLAEIKRLWGGPVIVKGIATGEDARIAVEQGIEVVYISNHGGRELDHGLGTMDILPEVVAAVGGKAEVWIDGGFVRGTDIVKALCLGAKAVAIARLQAWAVTAGGTDAVRDVLHNLQDEVANTIGLLGINTVAELGPQFMTRVVPMGPWHEHSSFRHIGPAELR